MDGEGLLAFGGDLVMKTRDLVGVKVAIIGAGMAGVAAGQALTGRAADVTIFEKSRGFGGRCASKRWEGHVVDHGAQYVTVRDNLFGEAVGRACGSSFLRLEVPILDERGQVRPDTGRWYHKDGNSRIIRDFGAGLRVITEFAVDDATTLLRENGGEFDHVVSTAPWPQTARLFGMEFRHDYIPCIAVLLAYSTEWPGLTREAYAISDHMSALAWSACENNKVGRVAAGFTVMVAQMSESFSREHLERPAAEYPSLVQEIVEDRWQIPKAARVASFGHRWRMARVAEAMTPPHVLPRGLHYAGDALLGSRVEDAWLSGHRLGLSKNSFLR